MKRENKKGLKMTLAQRVAGIIKSIDPNVDSSSDTFLVASILIASTMVGCDAERVADALEKPVADIAKYEDRLRNQRIWDAGGVDEGDWHEEGGDIAFWLQVSCVLGDVDRTWDADAGEWAYSMTDAGKAKVREILG